MQTVTGNATAIAEVPAGIVRDDRGQLVKPYHIIYPLPGRPLPEHGSLAKAEEAVAVAVQVTTVGARHDHAVEGADACRAGLLARDPSGDFTNAIAAGSDVVIDRRTSVLGAPEPSGGGLWQVADTYDLEVNST